MIIKESEPTMLTGARKGSSGGKEIKSNSKKKTRDLADILLYYLSQIKGF